MDSSLARTLLLFTFLSCVLSTPPPAMNAPPYHSSQQTGTIVRLVSAATPSSMRNSSNMAISVMPVSLVPRDEWNEPFGPPMENMTLSPSPTGLIETMMASAQPSSSPPSASPAASTGLADASSYMDIVEKWRGKLGLSDLTHDDTLQGNALKTAQDGNGQMKHELNPGTLAQVLAPGRADEFEKVFVGGWLCERPDLSGLDGVCSTMSQGWAYDGQTGHADILVSKSYSKIGCALADGIWACDLA